MSDPSVARLGPAVHAEPSWLRGIVLAVLIALATRVVVWSSAYAGALLRVRIQLRLDAPLSWQHHAIREQLENPASPLRRSLERETSHFAPLLRWDAGHYLTIVTGGYRYEPPKPDRPPPENQWNIAFFPLYPLVCRAVAPVLGSPQAALVLVSNLAALLAAGLLYGTLRPRSGHAAAATCVGLVFCWPAAAFLSFGYPASLALLLTVLTIALIERGRLVAAALACALATATRPTLIPLALLLGCCAGIRHKDRGLRGVLRAGGLTLIALAGALAYAAYLTWHFGSPWVYVENFRAGWVAQPEPRDLLHLLTLERIWDGLRALPAALLTPPLGWVGLLSPLTWNVPLSLLLIAAGVQSMVRSQGRRRLLAALGPLIFLQRYLTAGWSMFGIESLSRYLLVATPSFETLADGLGRRSAGTRIALFAAMLVLQAFWALHFGLSEWTG